jgi:2'-5' RNA ligase
MDRRLFVSVDLPDALAEDVAAVQEPFRPADGLRFTDPGQAHVTLQFLGDVPGSDVDDVREAVRAGVVDAGVVPFEVTYGGLGVFPSLEYISVVWLGVEDGGEALGRLHDALEDRTTELGFEPDDHEFTPHVTLARMDHAGGKERVQRLVRERDPTVGTQRVASVALTESELADDGPEYTTLERFEL